jgi:hypothetical protein
VRRNALMFATCTLHFTSAGGFDEPIQAIGFKEEEGVGESAAFILHTKSNVLLLERNRNALTTYTFAEFFRQVGKIKGHINLHPVLQHDVYEKVFNAKVVRKLVVQIAGPDNIGAAVAEMEPSVNEMLKARQSLKAPVAEFTYSIGRKRKEGLSLEHVLGAVRDFLALNRGQDTSVEKLVVNGSLGPHEDFSHPSLRQNNHRRLAVDIKAIRKWRAHNLRFPWLVLQASLFADLWSLHCDDPALLRATEISLTSTPFNI